MTERHDARLVIESGPAVSGPVLRLAVIPLALPGLLAISGGSIRLLVALGLIALLVLRPGAASAGAAVALVAAALALGGPIDAWRLSLVVLTVHAIWVHSSIAHHVGWRTAVELIVLRRMIAPFLVVQAALQVLAGAGSFLAGGYSLPWLSPVSTVSAAILLWYALVTLQRGEQRRVSVAGGDHAGPMVD